MSDTGEKQKRKSDSVRSGLTFPVRRFNKRLKGKSTLLKSHKTNHKSFKPRVQRHAAIRLTAAVEYLCAELLDIAGSAAVFSNMKRINHHHITLAIKNDFELKSLMNKVVLSDGQPTCLKKKTKPKKTIPTPKSQSGAALVIIDDSSLIN